jgi:hypothetical protein
MWHLAGSKHGQRHHSPPHFQKMIATEKGCGFPQPFFFASDPDQNL